MIQDLAAASGVAIGNIDVYDGGNQLVLAQGNLHGSDFTGAGTYQPFTLTFSAAPIAVLSFACGGTEPYG